MATIAAPYGLRPVNLIGGQTYVGSTRMIPISSGFATNVFFGQPVGVAAGVLTAAAVTTAVPSTGTIGIFLGCTFTDPNLRYKVFRQNWPTGTVASDAVAYIADDPAIVMQVQCDGTLAATALGKNIALAANAGNTTTGNWTTAASASSIATTATLPFRVVGFVDGPDSRPGDAFTDILVKFNAPNATAIVGGHAYFNPTGA